MSAKYKFNSETTYLFHKTYYNRIDRYLQQRSIKKYTFRE